MLDETTVETHMSKEACHPFDAIGGWQVLYNLYLHLINLNIPIWNEIS